MAERRLPRGLLDPESQAIAEAYEAIPSVRRQTRGLLSLDPQEEQGMGQTAFEVLAGFIPGVGQLLAGRDIERARRAGDPAAAALAATEFVPFGRLAGMMRRPGPIMSELDAHHGSPHRFPPTETNPLGEFDASKIGTGEGAQAYGHGIYLAESPDVAKDYATRLWKNKYPAGRGEIWAASSEFYKAQKKYLQSLLDNAPKETKDALENQMDVAIEGIKKAKRKVGPQFYTADLPDEMIDRMLDWDAPVDESFSARIMAAVRKNDELNADDFKDALGLSDSYFGQLEDGRAVYQLLKNSFKSDAKASEFLREAGIPGIKYLDAGSRAQGGTETRNFVVFPGEEKKVKILKRE